MARVEALFHLLSGSLVFQLTGLPESVQGGNYISATGATPQWVKRYESAYRLAINCKVRAPFDSIRIA